MVDPEFQEIERARERNFEAEGVEYPGLVIDGKVHPGCPECGGFELSDRDARAREHAGGIEQPPYRMVCESCGHEWEED